MFFLIEMLIIAIVSAVVMFIFTYFSGDAKIGWLAVIAMVTVHMLTREK